MRGTISATFDGGAHVATVAAAGAEIPALVARVHAVWVYAVGRAWRAARGAVEPVAAP